MHNRRTAFVGLGLAGVIIAALTLFPVKPSRWPAPDQAWWCVTCGIGLVDSVLNLVLFVPFGLALRAARVSALRATIACLAFTLCIEVLQIGFVPGRDANLRDAVANTLGGLVGFASWPMLSRVVRPSAHQARALGTIWALGWVLTRLSTLWLLQPSLPAAPWYAQLAPRNVYDADFPGLVGEFSAGAWRTSRSGKLDDEAVLRESLVSGQYVVVDLTANGATTRLASVVSVMDDERREVLLLGQVGTELRWRLRTHAADVGLRVPQLGLPGALATAGPVRVTASAGATGWTLSAHAPASSEEAFLPRNASLGWMLLMPFDIPARDGWWIGATVWSASWGALLAYWFGVGFRHGRWLSVLASGGILWLPALLGANAPHLAESLSLIAVSFLVAGWSARRTLI